MEVFFSTPELVGILMDHISISDESQMTLATCAQVNRLFSKEAIRALWREIRSMNHFLNLLPPDVTHSIMASNPKGAGNNVIHDPSKWEKALQYASFVRNVDLSSHYSSTWSGVGHLDKIIEAFYTTFGDQIFFRNLRRSEGLRLCASRHLTLLSPSLQHLEVSMTPDTSTNLESIIQGMQRLTSLKSLQIYSSSIPVLDDLSNLVPKAEGLTTLSLYLTTNATQLYSIQNFCNLRHLLLDVAQHGFKEEQFEGSRMTMPQLQELEIIGFSRVVVYLIRDVLPMPKESLRLQLIIDPYPERDQAIASLMSSISTLAPPTVKNVDICYTCVIHLPYYTYDSRIRSPGSASTRTGRTIDMDMVRPVFQLEHLQKLTMNLNTPVKITTDGMHSLIRGLPHIHHLNLVGIHRSRKPVFSPSSLLILAREAPQLRYLAMEMTGNWKALRKELESFSSSSHLEVLNVGYSVLVVNEDDIEDEVFRALKRLFPLLRTLETNHKHTGWFCQIAGKAWGNISDRFDVKPTRVMSSRSCWYIGFQGEEAQDSD